MIRMLIEGDYHSADLLGLAHPDHWPARKQRLAQTVWDWRTAELKDIGRVDIHILGGDMIEGPGRKETLGLLATEMDEQVEMAEEAVREVRADYRYFTFGTPFHVVSFAKAEKQLAKAFGERPRMEWRIGPLHGRYFMDRHVLGRSDIPYGQGTPLWKEWVRDEVQAAMEEYRAADFHSRHHVHYYFEMKNNRGHAVACPALKLPTPPDGWGSPYPWTLKTQYYSFGMLLVEIDRSGEIFVRPRIMPMKMAIKREYVCPEIKENTSAPPGRSRSKAA